MRKIHSAFTLTELLVALGVIAILCAILLPVIFNLIPNQNVIMAKRAFYATQTVIADLINSEACYPDKTSSVSGKKIGFDDGYGYPNCQRWDGEYNTSTINSEGDAPTKFKTLFEDKLGVLTDEGAKDNFQTSNDGMDWKFTSAAFTNTGTGGSILLTVDVNGADKPNCSSGGLNYDSELGNGGEDCATRTNGFDRFQMKIHGNGQIDIIDDWAKDAVKVNKDITAE